MVCLVAFDGRAQATSAAPISGKPRLAILALTPQGVSTAQSDAMTDGLIAALSARGLFEVISFRDIETALGAERQRQLLGVCDATPEACGASLGESLSAPFVLSGQLSRVGNAFQLSLQTVDTHKARAIGRSHRLASSLEALQQLVPYAAAEATGVPLPPPPSRVVPLTLLSVGGLAFVSGAVFGVVTLTQERLLNDELCPTGVSGENRCTGQGLRERAFYLTQNESLGRQKAVSAALMGVGVVVVSLGLWVMPPETQAKVSAWLVPTSNGAMVVGGFW
jgi:TolB-like protein